MPEPLAISHFVSYPWSQRLIYVWSFCFLNDWTAFACMTAQVKSEPLAFSCFPWYLQSWRLIHSWLFCFLYDCNGLCLCDCTSTVWAYGDWGHFLCYTQSQRLIHVQSFCFFKQPQWLLLAWLHSCLPTSEWQSGDVLHLNLYLK